MLEIDRKIEFINSFWKGASPFRDQALKMYLK